VLPGTYLVHRGHPTTDERVNAGLLYAGAESMLTGAIAAHYHGLRNLQAPPDQLPVHLLIPEQRQRKSAAFALIERTRRFPTPVIAKGVPISPLPRSIFDATRRYVSRPITRALILEAVQRHQMPISQFRHELAKGQRRWTAVSREVGGDALVGIRSVPEGSLRDLIVASPLPEPLWNPRLLTENGSFLAEPDGYYENLGIALEVDSRKHHYEDEHDYEKTWERHEEMSAAGVIVLRITPVRINGTPTLVLQSITRVRQAHAGRTPPPLIIQRKRAS
jgi:hypothetical protein